jgi:hypothetical protein
VKREEAGLRQGQNRRGHDEETQYSEIKNHTNEPTKLLKTKEGTFAIQPNY